MTGARRTAVTLLLTVAMAAWMAAPAIAQGGGAKALEGVWAMSLTLRDCASGAALGPPFRSLLTFHAGGTLSESAGTTQFAAGQRSPGHGLWAYSGSQTYAVRFVSMILFDTPPAPPAPGFQAGWLLVGSTLTLVSDAQLSITATAQFYDLNRSLYRQACPTGTAERFQ